MTKRPPPGKCVHCLRDPVPRTWDHVFPKSWYPDTTLENIAKWQIPACLPCNQEYGGIEQDLLLRVGLCIDPHAFESGGIVPKVLRSLDPRYAKNEKDRRAREAKRSEILRQLLKRSDIPQTAVFPNFEEKWGRPPERQEGVPIPARSMHQLFEKIVRGIFYLEDRKFIEPPYSVDLYPLRNEHSTVFTSLLDRFGQVYAREPGIVVRRAVAQEDGISSVFEIEIWRCFKMYAVASLRC
jgi:hypothetical protein